MITYKVNNFPVSQQTVPGSLLGYQTELLEKTLGFQVTHQSSQITDFLKRNKFQASNGLKVDISHYPEYKESNLTIYLQGDDSFKNLKTDYTQFARNYVAKARKEQIEAALRELVATVKKLYKPIIPSWSFPTRNVPPVECVCFPNYVFGF